MLGKPGKCDQQFISSAFSDEILYRQALGGRHCHVKMNIPRLLTAPRLRFTALAAIAAAGVVHSHRQRRTHLDSPPSLTGFNSQQNPLRTYTQRLQSGFEKAPAKEDPKKEDAEIINKNTDLDDYGPAFEDDDENSWATFSRNVGSVRDGIARLNWSDLSDKFTDFVIPSWARVIPGLIQKLQFELTLEEGTLADDIWQEAHDAEINPEIMWNATVRVGETLCRDEIIFRQRRKQHMIPAFARYLGLQEKDINPEDIPTIAVCGSGGGLRALVAGTSSYLSTQEAGLFDCVTYTAGVSGSCWLQALYYSSVGKQNHRSLLNHIKDRIGTHIAFPPTALKLVTSAPTNKFILSGFIEKLKGDPGASFGLVDVYSLLLAARLMVPKGDLDVKSEDLKLSNQREFLNKGQNPMPIYTAVRHEIPLVEKQKAEKPSTPSEQADVVNEARKEAWFQWFELTPWEVWCEEFSAGIPTWALGRPFSKGVNKLLDTGVGLPEIRQSLLLGIYGSAFCATLSHYYKEVRPLLIGMVGFGSLNELLEEKNEDLIKVHPIEPATIPNFVWGMKDKLPSTCPESVFEQDHLQLMDAGMSNNLPIYPLLRPGRDVDVLVAFDASADIQKENWLSVVDGYARQRGIKSWPIGAGWPKKSDTPAENVEALEQAEAEIDSPQAAAVKIAKAREDHRQAKAQEDEQHTSETKSTGESPTTTESKPNASTDLSYCNIWIGTKEERTDDTEPPPSKRVSWDNADDSTFQLMSANAGIAVIYFPLLPNPDVEGVDPDKTDYLSTWNFIYTPEQVEKVAELAKRNFAVGEDATKRTIRAVYERKKKQRIEAEEAKKVKWWKRQIREGGDTFSGGR